jgi:hypothetical protein
MTGDTQANVQVKVEQTGRWKRTITHTQTSG